MSPVTSLEKTSLSWYAGNSRRVDEGNGLNYIMESLLNTITRILIISGLTIIQEVFITIMIRIIRNIVFADTLEVIENIVLSSISNYFLRFSNEYRRIKGRR